MIISNNLCYKKSENCMVLRKDIKEITESTYFISLGKSFQSFGAISDNAHLTFSFWHQGNREGQSETT